MNGQQKNKPTLKTQQKPLKAYAYCRTNKTLTQTLVKNYCGTKRNKYNVRI